MSKPQEPPRWATDGAAEVTEPSEGEKDAGWFAGFRPPSFWMNWIALQVYRWIRYVGGVPSANLIIRNAAPVLHPDGGGNTSLTMVAAFPGLGENKFEGGPTDKHDEWWLATSGATAPGAARLWRYRRGLGAAAGGIATGDSTIATVNGKPQSILYDGAQYLLAGQDASGDPTAETSVGGDVWINAHTFVTGATSKVVWNGLTGASHRYVHVGMGLNGAPVSISSDSGATWGAQSAIDGSLNVFDMDYSSVLGLYCAVGIDAGGIAIFTSADAITWAVATGVSATYEWESVTVRPSDGQFVVVGNNAAGPDRGVIAISSGSGTVFTELAIVPSVQDFRSVIAVGDRFFAVAVEIDDTLASNIDALGAYESRKDAASGTWNRAGTVVSALPGTADDVNLDQRVPIAGTGTEIAFRARLLPGSQEVLISELSHPDLED